MAFVSAATAQTISCIPPKDCGNGVAFLPAQAQYAAAVGSTLGPTSPTTPIAFKVQQDHGNAYSVDVSRSPWASATSLDLEARITLSGPHVTPTVLDWQPISTVPDTVFTEQANQADVSVEYRLRIDGTEPAGTYVTTVTFHAWDSVASPSQGKKGRDSVTMTVTVTIPTYVSLRLDGVPAGQTASVRFDYSLSNFVAYLHAVDAGTLLYVTSADFDRLEVATNNPTGYRVDVSIAENAAPTGSTLGVPDIRLFGGVRADGHVFSSTSATRGYLTLLKPSDFGLHVDGGEIAGSYRFTATYTAKPNP